MWYAKSSINTNCDVTMHDWHSARSPIEKESTFLFISRDQNKREPVYFFSSNEVIASESGCIPYAQIIVAILYCYCVVCLVYELLLFSCLKKVGFVRLTVYMIGGCNFKTFKKKRLQV